MHKLLSLQLTGVVKQLPVNELQDCGKHKSELWQTTGLKSQTATPLTEVQVSDQR